jgi:hypothetical protein
MCIKVRRTAGIHFARHARHLGKKLSWHRGRAEREFERVECSAQRRRCTHRSAHRARMHTARRTRVPPVLSRSCHCARHRR